MKRSGLILLLGLFILSASCNIKKAEQKKKAENVDSVPVDSTTMQMKYKMANNTINNVYFKANGTEPFWSLTISEKMIKLNIISDSILTPHTNPVYAQDRNIKRYTLQTESAGMNIEITQKECINAMSGIESPYSVTVEFKKGRDKKFTELEGCGHYLTDYRLHDIWVLEALKGKKITKDDFIKKFPQMEINTGTNTFTGTTGCNRMNGQLFFEYDKLRFQKIMTTKMMCLPDNKKEREFLDALRTSTTYSIANNRLTLSNPDGDLLVFKKLD